jgi:hypothetical protein
MYLICTSWKKGENSKNIYKKHSKSIFILKIKVLKIKKKKKNQMSMGN